MYKVLIADDEPIAVESIAYMIKRNFDEVGIIETSRSGKDAIEKAYQLHPDIIIMDINMPGINGLEAMKQIRTMNPTVSLIVISAFDYFDYAVEAVALDVEEYLLKPVKEVKFIETFAKVLERVKKDSMNRKKDLEQQERLKMMLPILERDFMNTLCMYGEDPTDLQSYCDLLGCHNQGGYCMAVEFGYKKGNPVDKRIGTGLQGEKLYEEMKSIFKSSCSCIVSPVILNRIILYVFDGTKEDVYEQKLKSVRTAQRILERAARIYPDINIGIGRYHKDIQSAKKSYQEAVHSLRILSAAENGGSFGHANILHEDDISERSKDTDNDYEQLFEDEIYRRVQEGSESSISMAFEQIYERMSTDDTVSFDSLKKYMIGLVVGFAKRFGDIADNECYRALIEIINAMDTEKLFHISRRYITETIHQITSGRQKKANSIIQKADQYIQDHYREDILLEDVAKSVNLSPYYFSRFYKEVSGINFSDKLSAVRMEKAKELLKREELSIKDVSYLAGYREPNYFSRLFKKATGLTASEYKKTFGV